MNNIYMFLLLLHYDFYCAINLEIQRSASSYCVTLSSLLCECNVLWERLSPCDFHIDYCTPLEKNVKQPFLYVFNGYF